MSAELVKVVLEAAAAKRTLVEKQRQVEQATIDVAKAKDAMETAYRRLLDVARGPDRHEPFRVIMLSGTVYVLKLNGGIFDECIIEHKLEVLG